MQIRVWSNVIGVLVAAALVVAIGVTFHSCRPASNVGRVERDTGIGGSGSSEADLFVAVPPDEALQVGYAENLTVERNHGVIEITIHEAWPGAAPIRYAIVSAGSVDPVDPDRFDVVLNTAPRRVISLVTPSIAHMRDLNLLDRIVGVEQTGYVYDDSVLHGIDNGVVKTVGGGPELDLERVLALRPDMVFLSALGPDDTALRRVRSAGIPAIVLADWREHSPLGRAEWIKLFGLVFDRAEEADELFASRAIEYEQLRDRLSTIRESDRPRIMANGPWQATWPTPAGESYMARLFSDAGGDYIWRDISGAGSVFLDLETVLERAIDADFWVNLNYDWHTLSDVLQADPRLGRFHAFQTGAMYHLDRRTRSSGANDFWESGAGQPDLVLADLAAIFHPALFPDHDLHYYRRLGP